MKYEDLIALREAGYPQGGRVSMNQANVMVEEEPSETQPAVPTVAMLIVKSIKFKSLVREDYGYLVNEEYKGGRPEEALINLWLAK